MNRANRQLFGNQLKKCREQANITQEDLAYEIGLQDGSSISHYERGENIPSRERLSEIVQYLRKRGAMKECIDKLYEYCGYVEPDSNDPLFNRLRHIREDLKGYPTSLILFQETLSDITADWEK